jgi:preprotein translocase subunit SecE
VAVLAISIFFAAFLGLSDLILSKLVGSLIY